MQVSDDPRVGTQLAGYRVEALLGRGGMSVVYLAEDLRLKRNVALKILASHLAADPAFRERFLRESQLAASIDHPNIVPIYEAGETGELLFIAMRYVEGSDLKERLRHGRLEPREAIGILAQVASALDAAHARGLVHRDVKPSNVLLDIGAGLDGSDHAYLADFGITKRVTDETGIGDDGHLMGTIDYVAPEQIAGEDVDGHADVYSLGCVLYECLVGEPPFRRKSDVAVLFGHLEAEPPAASATRPELPPALDSVIARALAKDPDNRYSTCRELARAALAVTVDEASRRLADVASRAAAGRSDLSQVEAELAGKVIDLQLAREQARVLAGQATPARIARHGMCPFKGLASFEPADADYFFGRERLIAELVARLVGASFLGIVGPSGSGKSSVLRAGLLPALAGGVLPGSERWRRVLIRPGERPVEELRRMLASGAKDPVAETLDAMTADERILLAVDQLEELFTACADEAQRGAFLDMLSHAAADPQGRAIVAVAVRADFYGRFAGHPALADLLGGNHVLVGPMQASELRRAVELPAGRVGLKVEQELADALVDDVEGEPGALPLLSTALLELWQKRQDNTLSAAVYRESGGVQGAVARLAEGTYARIPDEHRLLVRAVMLRLVGEGEGDAAVRRRAPLAEFDLEYNQDAERVLGTLADSRLVTVSQGSVEVAHEALLREWPRLAEWIEEDAEGRRLRRHITQAATEWDEANRDQAELYRGARLAAALDWSADHHALELNELERQFMAESREASEKDTKRVRKTNRRLRGLLIGVAVLLAAAVVGGVFALLQRGEARDAAAEARDAAEQARTAEGAARAAEGQARDAETTQLAQRLGAQALVEEDLALSLLLARQAVAIDDRPQTRGYLLADLQRVSPVVGIMHPLGADPYWPLQFLAVSPDGGTLAMIAASGELLRFDTETYELVGQPIQVATFPEEWQGLAYSPDGRTLAVETSGSLRLFDARTGEQLAETSAGGVTRLAFTSDGSLLVALASGPPASITVHDATTLEPIGDRIHPDAFAGEWVAGWWASPSFAITPDDRSIITASEAGELAWWDLRSGRKTRSLPIADSSPPVALALSPDGLTAAVGIAGGIQLVDLPSGDVQTVAGGATGRPNWLVFSPDGTTVAATNLDGTVTLWDAESGTVRETLRGHSGSVQQPAFSPDGRTLYTASHDGTVIAWDLAGDRGVVRPFTFTSDLVPDDAYYTHPGRFSPDGRLVAVGLEGEGLALFDARTLEQVGAPLSGTDGEVMSLAFSPDGRTLAAATREGRATVWDVDSRSLRLGPFSVSGTVYGSIVGVGFVADGTTLAVADSSGLALWDVATGDPAGRLEGFGTPHTDVAASADGTLVASAQVSFGGATVWDVASGEPVANVLGLITYESQTVALSPDGRLLAVGGFSNDVRILDIPTRTLLHELYVGGAGAFSLEFTPDGRVLAVSGLEPTASLWDVATGTQIGLELPSGGAGRTALDLSADGKQLLMTSVDGHGAVWDFDPESWKQRACAIAGRTLTEAEWEQFLPGRPYEPACR
jgi:WD40 repeat protein/tRNA A-37 threonylcarbamoyl transferase component Bud32